jgi:expansin (peptidoglycan-binding protein)
MHRVTQQQHIRPMRPWWLVVAVVAAVGAVVCWATRPHAAACRSAEVVGASARVMSSSAAAHRFPSGEQIDSAVEGQARYYTFGAPVACSFSDLQPDGYYVGLPPDEYDEGAPCGAYVDVTSSEGTVRAQVVDRCAGCVSHQYDLSTAAFDRVADRGAGVTSIRISRVHNPEPAPGLSYRVQDGSTSDWLGLLISGTGNPLQRVEIRSDSGGPGYALSRGSDNYWTITDAGPGPFTVVVTDADGHQAQIRDLTVVPGRWQRTGVRLYRLPLSAISTSIRSVSAPMPAVSPATRDGHCT